MTLAPGAFGSSDPPDVVRACIRMTGAGVAVAVLPYGLVAGTRVALEWFHEGRALGDDDVTGGARILLACTLLSGAGVVALGIREAWRIRRQAGSGPRLWLTAIALTLAAWCVPPMWFFTTPWMFVGSTLAVRPLWWAHRAGGDVSAEEARDHLRIALWLTGAVTLLAHVMAWLLVLATAHVVPADEFARVDAIRRGEPVERRVWESTPDDAVSGGPALYDVVMSGAAAAGRSVGGDMSYWFASLGYWPELAQLVVAPTPEGPTRRESWGVALLAFIASTTFWLPWMLLWTWLGAREARRLSVEPM